MIHDDRPLKLEIKFPAGADENKQDALYSLSSQVSASSAIAATQRKFVGVPEDLTAMADELKRQSESEGTGVDMLFMQAKTLELMFYQLVQRAAIQTDFDVASSMMKLAFKAQTQSRSTLTAISDIRHPRITNNIGQVNNATGHQQVNNGALTRTGKNQQSQGSPSNTPNKLSEGLLDDILQDASTPTGGTREDHEGEALEKSNGPDNRGG